MWARRPVAPSGDASPYEKRCDEHRWLAAASALDAQERASLLDALVVTAGLRGPTRHPERRFLQRVGDALGGTVDFAQIDAVHQHLDEGSPVLPN